MQKKSKKQKKHFFSFASFSLGVILSVAFSFSNPNKVQAWDAIPAAIFKQATEEISYSIKGITMGSLKQAAIKMLSRQMDRFISGVTRNGVRFVTDWEDYLIDNPARNAQHYVNDYISSALSGRGSVSYKKAKNSVLGASTTAGEGFAKEAVLGDSSEFYDYSESYAKAIEYSGQQIVEPEQWKLSYFDEPEDMFQGDDLSKMNLFVMGDGNGGNTIWDADSAIKNEYVASLEKEKVIAKTKAEVNQGYISEEVDGKVAKPGILFKELQANIENLPNLAMVSATNVGELIAATVSKAITGAIDGAISGVERTINREVTKVTNKAVQEVNKNVNAYGPGALYK